MTKSENELRDAFAKLNRHKTGRKARITGTVEQFSGTPSQDGANLGS